MITDCVIALRHKISVVREVNPEPLILNLAMYQ